MLLIWSKRAWRAPALCVAWVICSCCGPCGHNHCCLLQSVLAARLPWQVDHGYAEHGTDDPRAIPCRRIQVNGPDQIEREALNSLLSV